MTFEKGAIVTAPNGKQYTRDDAGAWQKDGGDGCFFEDDIKTLIEDHDWKLSYPEKPKSVFSGKVAGSYGRAIVDIGCHTGLPHGTEVLVIPTKNVRYNETQTVHEGHSIQVCGLRGGDHRVIVVKDEGGQG